MNKAGNVIANIQPPAKFDPLGDKFNEWWISVELYLRVLGKSVSDDTQAAIILSLFHHPTLQKYAQNEKLNIFELGFTELKKIIHSVLDTDKPLFYERFATLNLKQDSSSSIDEWAAAVMQQTQRFELEKFTLDDLQTLIFVIGLSNKELQRELLKHINSMHSSKTASLSFTAAYRICKDHLAYNDLCRTIHSGSTKSELIYQIHNQEEESDKMDDTKRDTDNENLLFKITDQKDQSHQKNNERQFKDIQTPPKLWGNAF